MIWNRWRISSLWLLCLGWMVVWGSADAWGQTLSYRLRVPSRVPGQGDLSKRLHSNIRSVLMQKGFVIQPTSAMRDGYHLDISVAIEESFRTDEPARCTVQLAFEIVVMPKKRLVMRASSSGSSQFNKATAYTHTKRDHLRQLAMKKAVQYFKRNVREAIDKIEERKKNLPKNMILGQKWNRIGSARWRGSVPAGKPPAGGVVRWKWLPAGVDALRHRPPLQ